MKTIQEQIIEKAGEILAKHNVHIDHVEVSPETLKKLRIELGIGYDPMLQCININGENAFIYSGYGQENHEITLSKSWYVETEE